MTQARGIFRNRARQGFSLVEMAMILIVIGLVAVAVFPRIIKKTEREVFREGKSLLRGARDEIIGFAIEKCFLPADDLNLREYRHQTDRWTGNLTFRPAPELTQNALLVSGKTLDTATSSLRINQTGTVKGDAIAFIVASPGKNGRFEDRANLLTASTVKIPDYRETGSSVSDDVYDYVTLSYLQSMVPHCSSKSVGSAATSGYQDLANNLSSWTSNPSFQKQSGQSSLGTTAGYMAAYSNMPKANSATSNSLNPFAYSTTMWNATSQITNAWALNERLGYDLQLKQGWGYQLRFGLGGISFRHHPVATGGNETYGVSFVRYNSTATYNDWIASPLRANSTLSGRRLIILWKQTMATDGSGKWIFDWLAFKNLDSDSYLKGNQWQYDGQCVTDNSAIMVRVRDAWEGAVHGTDIQVFYADSSVRYGPAAGSFSHTTVARPGNTVATDTTRRVYYPSYAYTTDSNLINNALYPQPFPAWATNETAVGSQYYNQYTGVWTNMHSDSYTQVTGWTLRSLAPEGGGGIPTLKDAGTIRDTDSRFFPPTGQWPAGRREFGIHAMGNLTSANAGIWYDEFAVKFRVWP